jgi:hypothetical protein
MKVTSLFGIQLQHCRGQTNLFNIISTNQPTKSAMQGRGSSSVVEYPFTDPEIEGSN